MARFLLAFPGFAYVLLMVSSCLDDVKTVKYDQVCGPTILYVYKCINQITCLWTSPLPFPFGPPILPV